MQTVVQTSYTHALILLESSTKMIAAWHHRQLQTRAYQGSCPGICRPNSDSSSTLTYIMILFFGFSGLSAQVDIQICSRLCLACQHVHTHLYSLPSFPPFPVWTSQTLPPGSKPSFEEVPSSATAAGPTSKRRQTKEPEKNLHSPGERYRGSLDKICRMRLNIDVLVRILYRRIGLSGAHRY